MREVESFLDCYPQLISHASSLNFEGVTNPKDGVFYPGVSIDVPDYAEQEICDKLEINHLNFVFFRLSILGVKAPHQAHTDSVMGSRSLMVYLTDTPDNYGTSILKHKELGFSTVKTPSQVETLNKDMNDYNAWEIVHFAEAKPNKAFIFDANLIHRAEPVGGFGDNPMNGRLVLTAFFND